MLAPSLALGLLPSPAPQPDPAVEPVPPASRAATVDAPRQDIPWRLLQGRRLRVTMVSGVAIDGELLGLEGDTAVIEADDGVLHTLPVAEIQMVRTIKPSPPTPQIPTPKRDASLAFREAFAVAHRDRAERLTRITSGTTIASGVVAAVSLVPAGLAEAFNVRRWSLTELRCGESYGGQTCGWTTGAPDRYDEFDDVQAILTANSIAAPLTLAAAPLALVPSTMLRHHMGDRQGRGLHIAAWTSWGLAAGGALLTEGVAWRQSWRSETICDPSSASDCQWITETRGAPQGAYAATAALGAVAAILAIIDARQVVRRAKASLGQTRAMAARASFAIVPIRIRGGGALRMGARF